MKGLLLLSLIAFSSSLFAQNFSSESFSWTLVNGYIVVSKSPDISSGKYKVIAKMENIVYDKTNGKTLKTPQTIYRLMLGKKYMYITLSTNKNDTTSDIYYPDPDLSSYLGAIYMTTAGEGYAQWSVTQKIVTSLEKSKDWKSYNP